MPPASRRMRCALLAIAATMAWQAASAGEHASFGKEEPSAAARHIADWVLDSHDNAGAPFVVVDKLGSRVFVFNAKGRLQGAAPALLGLAPGDESVPGIGQRALASILPQERTTPAGRFVASLERSLTGDEILWVDYDDGVALHPVATSVVSERRLQRLASPIASEHRITYGCINVPAAFFRSVVAPLFRGVAGVVYVLPEQRSPGEVFGSYEVAPAQASGPTAPDPR